MGPSFIFSSELAKGGVSAVPTDDGTHAIASYCSVSYFQPLRIRPRPSPNRQPRTWIMRG